MAEALIEKPENQDKLVYVSNPASTSEPVYRFQTKESAKGFRYYEWTVKADTFDELKKINQEMRKYVDLLRGEDANSETDIPDRV